MLHVETSWKRRPLVPQESIETKYWSTSWSSTSGNSRNSRIFAPSRLLANVIPVDFMNPKSVYDKLPRETGRMKRLPFLRIMNMKICLERGVPIISS
jgi:hypothetical protein